MQIPQTCSITTTTTWACRTQSMCTLLPERTSTRQKTSNWRLAFQRKARTEHPLQQKLPPADAHATNTFCAVVQIAWSESNSPLCMWRHQHQHQRRRAQPRTRSSSCHGPTEKQHLWRAERACGWLKSGCIAAACSALLLCPIHV